MASKAVVGEKVGMTQVWDDDNRVVPVTVVRVAPLRVVQVKTTATDGYTALQVTYGEKEAKKLNQPEAGHFAKQGVAPGKRLVELRLDDVDGYEVGQEIGVDLFEAGDRIDVTAVSKGKGFAGVMKRYHFGGQPASHGTERKHRSRGSICSRASNRGHTGKPKKGMRMAGHMGSDRVTTRNHPLVKVDAENNLLLIKGALPGPNGSLLFVRKSVTARVKKEEQ